MNITVIATASRDSGALTIYKQFLFHLEQYVGTDNYIIFIHKTMPHPKIERVNYCYVDTTTTLRRLYFDYFKCFCLLKKNNFLPDLVFSLQNTGVYSLKHLPQCIYYHQALPFYARKWDVLKREERHLFFIKNIYPFFVRHSIGRKTYFIAQLPYVKDGIINHFGMPEDKVQVCMPDFEVINQEDVELYDYGDNKKHFVYPAIPAKYKEHETLIRALSQIKNNGDIVLHFTFLQDDYPELVELIDQLNLTNNIVFEGRIKHQKLLSMLKSSKGLLYPSTIETLGLPLLEAAFLGLPIIAADVVYARQVLDNYIGVTFINAYNYDEWAIHLNNLSNSDLRYKPITMYGESSWIGLFKWFHTHFK